MTASSIAQLAVIPPDRREVTAVPGFTATVKLAASETGGISIVEHRFDPGVLVPPHRHTREDEISCVISGEIGFRSDGREVSLGAGGYIVKPRGELHSMWNAGSEPARMIWRRLLLPPAAAQIRPSSLRSRSASGSLLTSPRCPTSSLVTGCGRFR
jgi:quercetin dioxygenase-like cupin family protein